MLLLKAKSTVPLENKDTDDAMNIIFLLLSALLLQTRQWKWQLVGPWIKLEVKKTFSFLDLYSFMLWNGLGSGFGSHLRIFPFASSISKHSRDLVFSLMWKPSAAAALSLLVEMKPSPSQGSPLVTEARKQTARKKQVMTFQWGFVS